MGLIRPCQTMSMAGKSFMLSVRRWLLVGGTRWRFASRAFRIATVRKELGRAVVRKRRQQSAARSLRRDNLVKSKYGVMVVLCAATPTLKICLMVSIA